MSRTNVSAGSSLKSAWRATPALLTSTSTRPHRSTARATVASTASRSATSHASARARSSPPSAVASARRRSSRRATSTTRAPRAARSRASCSPMPLEAPVTITTRSRKSVRRATATAGSGAGYETQREPDEGGHHPRPEQLRVVHREPALVLPHAGTCKRAQRHVADLVRDLHGEVVRRAVRGVAELHRGPDAAERLQQHAPDTADEEPRLLDDGKRRPMMRGPVGEEEDVTRLLLHDAVEDLDQRTGEECGVGRDPEEAEGEEGVEAIPGAHAHESPLGIARDLGLVVRVWDRVVPEQEIEQA